MRTFGLLAQPLRCNLGFISRGCSMAERPSSGEKIGNLIGDILGFFWCLAILCGAYGIGAWAARYFLGENHQDAVGLLAALAVIWMNERENAQHRWQRMNETFDRLFERLPR
jgi:hypothetical protein